MNSNANKVVRMNDTVGYLSTKGKHPIQHNGMGIEAIFQCFFPDCNGNDKDGHLYINKETGQYKCHKCGEEGNSFTLKSFFKDNGKEKGRKPNINETIQRIQENDKSEAFKYLTKRCISKKCTERYEGQFYFLKYRGGSIAFPVFHNDEITSLNYKILSGGTEFLKGCPVKGGHWPKVSKFKKKCILVESCINALTLLQFPSFKKRYTIIASFASSFVPDILSNFEEIRIYIDNDGVSKKWAQKVKNEYPDKIVKCIKWPKGSPEHFDVNDLAKKLKEPVKIEKALQKLKFQTLEVLEEPETKPIHLIDLEKSSLIGERVSTEMVVGGVGQVFHIPIHYEVDCGHGDDKDEKKRCSVCPKEVTLQPDRVLIDLCRMSDDQVIGKLRSLSGCENKPKVKILNRNTITELLAIPKADPSSNAQQRDYRDKIVYFNGSLPSSNALYKAIGKIIAEPKKQRASMLVTKMERLRTTMEDFQVTSKIKKQFRHFIPKCDDSDLKGYLKHQKRTLADITRNITKIYGTHRKRILLTELLAYHSPLEIMVNGERIKGTLDILIVGDSGEGKTAQMRRLIEKIELGKLISASTSSRTGVLYNLDNKLNDKRILRWGEYPLAHQSLLAIDEGQKLPLDQWEEFTTARERGWINGKNSLLQEKEGF